MNTAMSDDDSRQLRAHLTYQSTGYPPPGWYVTLRYAQYLHCPPWELPTADTDDRKTWMQRAGMAIDAEQYAREFHARKAERAQRRYARNVAPLIHQEGG